MHFKASLAKGKKLLPALMIIAGAGAIAFAVAADLLGIGGGGFGAKQITLLVTGVTMLLVGIIALTPWGRRYFTGLRTLAAGDAPAPSILLISAWFGLLAGMGQMIVWFAQRFYLGRLIRMGRDFLWMVPLANLLLFVTLGLILTFFRWRWPTLVSLRSAVLLNAFVTFSSLLLMVSGLHLYAAILLAAGLAVLTTRVIGRHSDAFYRLVRYTMGWMPVAIRLGEQANLQDVTIGAGTDFQISRREFLTSTGVAVAGLALGTRGWQAVGEWRTVARLQEPSPKAPNVLLVVLDTVRAASLSLQGYGRPTSPQLEQIAQKGTCFERAISTAPWTLPSHASMFTGHAPHKLVRGWWEKMSADYPTLAEVLSRHGYLTAGFVANNLYCAEEFGLNRGFAYYEDYQISPGQFLLSSSLGRSTVDRLEIRHEDITRKTAKQLTESFLHWLSSRGDRRPFFAFLNYYDAHDPYCAPEELLPEFASKKARTHYNIHEKLSRQEIQELKDAYDSCIAYVDQYMGLLFAELQRRTLLDNTLVIITSDHGEEFAEHGLMNHGGSLYLPSLHVPLLMVFPGLVPEGKRVFVPVCLADLPATIVDLIGLDENAFPGHSLAEYWDTVGSGRYSRSDTILSEVDFRDDWPAWWPVSKGDVKSLIRGQYHYIRNSDGREELYDIDSDPNEQVDLLNSSQPDQLVPFFRASLQRALTNDRP